MLLIVKLLRLIISQLCKIQKRGKNPIYSSAIPLFTRCIPLDLFYLNEKIFYVFPKWSVPINLLF